MKKYQKYFAVVVFLSFLGFGNLVVFGGTKEQKCAPPKTLQNYCQKIGKSAGSGGGSQHTTEFGLWEKGSTRSSLQSLFREKAPKAFQQAFDLCDEGLSGLDSACAGGNQSACQKFVQFRKEVYQIGSAFKDTQWNGGHFDPGSTPNLVSSLRSEMDPQNWANCKTEESQKGEGGAQNPAVIQGKLAAKHSPINKKFGPIVPLPDSKIIADNVWDARGISGREYSIMGQSAPSVSFASASPAFPVRFLAGIVSFFAPTAVASPLEDLFFRARKYMERVKSAVEGNNVGASVGRDLVGSAISKRMDSALDRYSSRLAAATKGMADDRAHQMLLTRDIIGKSMSEFNKRKGATMDMHEKSAEELIKSIDALSHISKSQDAATKCWKSGNKPSSVAAAENILEDLEEEVLEKLKFVARYYCPSADSEFVLRGTQGIWHSGLVVDKSGITLTHLAPFTKFKFHEKGCFLSLPDPQNSKKFAVYQAEVKIFKTWTRQYQLLYLLPRAPYEEGGKQFGVPIASERNYTTLQDYTESVADLCALYRVPLGALMEVFGYPLPEKEEPDRKFESEEGVITSLSNELQKRFTIAAEAKHEGFTGGLVLHGGDLCVSGMARIQRTDAMTTAKEIIPLPKIQEFLTLSLELIKKE